MPQIFQVLRCYKCSVFQLHQTNKSNKWACKVCGEKQSIKRFYGLGTAKECRVHVQKLNAIRGELDGTTNNTEQVNVSSNKYEVIITQPVKDDKPVKDSKWLPYVEEMGTIEPDTDTNMNPEGAEVVLEVPKKRRKLNTNNCKTNPLLSTVDHEKIHYNKTISSHSPFMPNAIINLTNTQSKTPKPSPYFGVKHPEETLKKIKPSDKFVLPLIDKHSKWAQFIDASDLTDKASLLPSFENIDSPYTETKIERTDLTDQANSSTSFENKDSLCTEIKPELPDQTSLLPALVNKDGLCTEIKMERLFSWRDDEPDVDSILSF